MTTQEEQFRRSGVTDCLLTFPTSSLTLTRSRLAALYSDFRQLRTLNPDGYSANIEAWRKGLADAAKGGHLPSRGASCDTLVLNLDEELLRALEHPEWGRPLALGTVVRDAMAKKEMMPVAEYQAAHESIYHKSWAVTPWGILSWGLRHLGLASGQDGEDHLPVGKLVIISNIEDAAKALARRISGYTMRTDRIWSKKLFCHEFANLFGEKNHLSQTDMDVLLTYISREKHMAAYDGQTVKFASSIENKPPIITSEDATIASLKTLMKDLEVQIDGTTTRVDALTIAAREAVLRKNRVSALATLRSKKLAEANLSRQSATLSQLEEIYSKIGQASDQIELVRIMEGSTGVLKALNAEIGGVERVDDVVDQLTQQMTQVNEIGDILAEAGQGTAIIDDIEVNDELEKMELEDMERKREAGHKAKEEEARREAENTRRRLDELEVVEQTAAEFLHKEAQKGSDTRNAEETSLEENNAGLAQMSLEEKKPALSAS